MDADLLEAREAYAQAWTEFQAEGAYYAEHPGHDERAYVLPFGSKYPKWRTTDVENHPFGKQWLGGMMALICKRLDEARTRPTRLIWTSCPGGVRDLPDRDKIGQAFLARHDQTGARLGEYVIVGIVEYDESGDVLRTVGDVPDVAFRMSTYK